MKRRSEASPEELESRKSRRVAEEVIALVKKEQEGEEWLARGIVMEDEKKVYKCPHDSITVSFVAGVYTARLSATVQFATLVLIGR